MAKVFPPMAGLGRRWLVPNLLRRAAQRTHGDHHAQHRWLEFLGLGREAHRTHCSALRPERATPDGELRYPAPSSNPGRRAQLHRLPPSTSRRIRSARHGGFWRRFGYLEKIALLPGSSMCDSNCPVPSLRGYEHAVLYTNGQALDLGSLARPIATGTRSTIKGWWLAAGLGTG